MDRNLLNIQHIHEGKQFLKLKNRGVKTKEMAKKLRALFALPGDLGSIPSIHMAAHTYLFQEI